jgi:hypothetical protein
MTTIGNHVDHDQIDHRGVRRGCYRSPSARLASTKGVGPPVPPWAVRRPKTPSKPGIGHNHHNSNSGAKFSSIATTSRHQQRQRFGLKSCHYK